MKPIIRIAYWLTKSGKNLEVSDEFGEGTNDHIGFLTLMEFNEISKTLGLTLEDTLIFKKLYTTFESTEEVGRAVEKVFKLGNIRFSYVDGYIGLDFYILKLLGRLLDALLQH